MFLVDSNILIEAKNRYYAFDIAPGFWTWLERAHQQGWACSIEAVRDELLEGDDELTAWAQANPNFFKPLDQPTTKHFSDLTTSERNSVRIAEENATKSLCIVRSLIFACSSADHRVDSWPMGPTPSMWTLDNGEEVMYFAGADMSVGDTVYQVVAKNQTLFEEQADTHSQSDSADENDENDGQYDYMMDNLEVVPRTIVGRVD